MVIVVPPGSSEDLTRKEGFYNPTFEYIKAIGFKELYVKTSLCRRNNFCLSLFWTSGRAEKTKAENCLSALPFSRSCRRSGRSPALPYPPHEQNNSTTSGGGLIFRVKKQFDNVS
jgi:hypothetical protein